MQFVPMTDELLYRAGGPPGRLVPYRTGVDCWHALGADGVYRFAEDAGAGPAQPPGEAANDVPLISPALARRA
jgi:hypothetical protein